MGTVVAVGVNRLAEGHITVITGECVPQHSDAVAVQVNIDGRTCGDGNGFGMSGTVFVEDGDGDALAARAVIQDVSATAVAVFLYRFQLIGAFDEYLQLVCDVEVLWTVEGAGGIVARNVGHLGEHRSSLWTAHCQVFPRGIVIGKEIGENHIVGAVWIGYEQTMPAFWPAGQSCEIHHSVRQRGGLRGGHTRVIHETADVVHRGADRTAAATVAGVYLGGHDGVVVAPVAECAGNCLSVLGHNEA